MRTEKYNLKRSLIELENIVNELVDYINARTFYGWFNDPLSDIDSFFGCRKERKHAK